MILNRARLGALAASFALSLSGTALAAAAGADIPPEPGEKWKVTTSMSMMGMTMPGMTSEICAPKNTDQAPVEANKDCQILDRRRSGNKETLHMRCTGKQKMEGTLELEYLAKDHYRGKMLAKMDEGEMTMNYEGQKLGGECDAAEMKRKMAQLQGQANAMTAKACADAAKNGQSVLFTGANPACTDAQSRQAFCSAAQSHKNFLAISRSVGVGETGGGPAAKGKELQRTAALCGFKAEAVRTTLCSSAEGKNEWNFLVGECPSIADPLAKRECAGRGFTTPVAPKYRDFCSAYSWKGKGGGGSGDEDNGGSSQTAGAAGGSQAPGAGNAPAADQAQQQKKPSAGEAVQGVLKNVDKLRGIFGR